MKPIYVFLSFLLFSFSSVAQQSAEPAGKILEAAYMQAAKENKNVFLLFHASWCGWCHKMDAAMNDPACKKSFEDNYVIVHLAVEESKDKKNLENPGAEDLKKKYHGESAGVPFWVILDKNKNILADCYIRKEGESMDTTGENIGCPGSEEEVAVFVTLLKKTSSITDENLSIISNRFRKNMTPDN